MQLLRAICHLAIVVIITIWAARSWSMPWPGLLAAAVALVITVIIWALFLSPKPVLHTDRFGQSLIELLLIGGAVAALLALGTHALIATGFGVVAAVLGYVVGARRATR